MPPSCERCIRRCHPKRVCSMTPRRAYGHTGQRAPIARVSRFSSECRQLFAPASRITFCARDMPRIVSLMPCNGAALASLSSSAADWTRSLTASRSGQATLRIFEVDHPATQAWKRQRLEQAGIAEPANLQFVPVDFVDTNARSRTVTSGLSNTLFSAFFLHELGVTQYLTLDDLDRTFGFVRGCRREARSCSPSRSRRHASAGRGGARGGIDEAVRRNR